MTAKIIVGVDGSETSEKALVWASRLGARAGVAIEPVLTWHYPVTSPTVLGDALAIPPLDDLEAGAVARLRTFLEATRPQCDPGATIGDGIVVAGAAGPVLCELAEDADLLVIGSRGYGGFKGLVLGSVSAHCANASPCPVAIIPTEWEPHGSTGVVVVGVDGSENSRAAVTWADEWARPDAVLHLVHAWTYPVGYNAETVAFDPALLEDAASATLDEAAATVTRHGTEVRCVRGDARHALHEAAAGSDLLVIGARGHTGLVRMLLGSVASSVVHHLEVPTVIVRADDE